MGKFLRLSNGVPRSFEESGSVTIYDQTLTVVASSPGAGEILGPIAASTAITLPASQTYTSGELELYVGSDRLNYLFDYVYVSASQISLTFQLIVGDRLRFRIDRPA